MDTDVTEPVETVSPGKRLLRPATVAGGTALVAVLTAIAVLVWVVSNGSHDQKASTKPDVAPSTPTAEPAAAPPSDASSDDALGLPSDLTAGLASPSGGPPSGGSAADFGFLQDSAMTGFAPSAAVAPAVPLPTLPPPPTLDWAGFNDLVEGYNQASNANAAVGLTGAIVGPTVGTIAASINAGAVLLGDIILYAALTSNGNGLNILSALQGSLPTLFSAPAAAALPSPEQVGLPAALSVSLPALASLSALPAPAAGLPGLPPPPPIGLPPPPPPIGLPPPPPPIGLPPPPPPIFFLPPPPALPIPSITRLLGLPF